MEKNELGRSRLLSPPFWHSPRFWRVFVYTSTRSTSSSRNFVFWTIWIKNESGWMVWNMSGEDTVKHIEKVDDINPFGLLLYNPPRVHSGGYSFVWGLSDSATKYARPTWYFLQSTHTHSFVKRIGHKFWSTEGEVNVIRLFYGFRSCIATAVSSVSFWQSVTNICTRVWLLLHYT